MIGASGWRLTVPRVALAFTLLASAYAASSAPTAPDAQRLLVMVETPVPRYRPGTGSTFGYGSGGAIARATGIANGLGERHGFTVVDDWAMPGLGLHCFVVSPRAGNTAEAVSTAVAAEPRVAWVQPLNAFRTVAARDPYYELQLGAGMPDLQRIHTVATGAGVRIALVDTGAELSHPDLVGQIATARDFVDGTRFVSERHGTAVAGIVAARRDNGIGTVGIAPDASVLALRACWEQPAGSGDGHCNSFTLAKALQFALLENVRVINLSLAGPPDRLLAILIDRAVSDGIVVVAAIDPGAIPATFPASHPRVLAVAGHGDPGAPGRAIFAPSVDVMTTLPKARWGFVTGSSFASAHVSALVALLLDVDPKLDNGRLLALLTNHGGASGTVVSTFDACAAIGVLSPIRACPE